MTKGADFRHSGESRIGVRDRRRNPGISGRLTLPFIPGFGFPLDQKFEMYHKDVTDHRGLFRALINFYPDNL
jgi:hypothetical protein